MSVELGKQNLSVTLFTETERYNILPRSIEFCYLIEDIFSFSLTGKLRFTDTQGIAELGPLTGREMLTISYGSPDNTRSAMMDIHKIDRIDPKKLTKPEDASIIELTLVDSYFRGWNYNKISKAWNNENIGNIVKNIGKDNLSIDDIMWNKFEIPREKLIHFDTHLRSPSECIQWLMNRGSSSVNNTPGYLMYRSSHSDGIFKFNFVTLESLLSNTKLMGPKDPTDSGIDPIYQFEQPNTYYINKIKDFKLLKVDFNALRSLTGSTITGYDIQTKNIINKSYNYKDAVNKFTILGKKSLFPTNMGINGSKIVVDGYGDEKILDNIWYGNWIKEYCHQQLAEIVVTGHVDRYAGGMIQIIWPSVDKKLGVINQQMSGKYLVKSITNYFGKNVEFGWVQKMTLIKNGYNNSPDTNLLNANRSNL